MDPNSSVHGQSWQDQELTKTNKQKSSIQISTAATDSGILMQNSLSHLSKFFREMPSYTKLTYFMIHGGPRVWVFSALHYCCYLGNQASTSLPSSMESKDAAHTNYLSTKPVFDTECSLIFPAALTVQFLFAQQNLLSCCKRSRYTRQWHQEKKQSHISKGKGKVTYGQHWE